MTAVSISGEYFRWLSYAGEGCRHDVLLRAGQPSAPNNDQVADDAADQFTESAWAHLRGWWEDVRLPLICRDAHALIGEGDVLNTEHTDDAGLAELYGRPFRWVDAWIAPWQVFGSTTYVRLGTAPDAAAFRVLFPDAAEPQRIRAYLLAADGSAGDLGDEGEPP